ncbi:beta-ketoacyl synthase N-terminal-like domain-containing protein [Ascidiimonas sp. W6]|uniref:beta-ketoacyl synthase N-terminal-like domain-containing protein n=1 Tax=Ascidiimonas meishanensis TaxID=3128903 RepID=UPI0030EE23A0
MSKNSEIKKVIIAKTAQVLSLDPNTISLTKPFSSYGLDSIIGVELISRINEALGIVLKTIIIFDYPSIEQLTTYITDNFAEKIHTDEQPVLSETVDQDSLVTSENLFVTEPVEFEAKESTNTTQSLLESVQEIVLESISKTLTISIEEISLKKSFSSYGIDSIIGVELINLLNNKLGIILKTIVIFDYTNVTSLVDFIVANYEDQLHFLSNNEKALVQEPTIQSEITALFETEDVLEDATSDFFSTNVDSQNGLFEDYFDNLDQQHPEEQEKWDNFLDIDTNEIQENEKGFQAVVIKKPVINGDISVAKIEPVNPEPNEVQVLVKAFPINFSDFLLLKGLYPIMPDFPFIPGVEVSGVVQKIGAGVTHVKPGDEIIALTRPEMGGQASIVNTDANFVVKKPSNISHVEAGGIAVPFLSTYVAIEKATLQKGEKILIQTGTGNNGLIAIQLAMLVGAEIITTVSSKEKETYLRKLGVAHIINHEIEDFEDRVKAITNNRGVDVVLNTVAGKAIQKGINLLAPNGRYVELAVFGLQTSKALNLSNLIHNQTFYSLNIKKFFLDAPEKRQKYLNILATYLKEDKVKATVHKTYPFSKIKEAYQEKEKREVIGRIMVEMPEISLADETKVQIPISQEYQKKDIAIIGYSGRFPDAANAEELWKNLCNEKDSIIEVPEERWSNEEYYDPNPENMEKTYCKWGGFMKDIDKFDANFFNISPKEAIQTDPQQRIFLQESYRAIEHAGYGETKMTGKRCGVFVGVGPGGYLKRMEEGGVTKQAQSFWGNETSVLAARISYYLNLKGPSIAINTACSSSLVATHLACSSILSGESEMAIAGGVFISIDPDYYLVASNGNMLSPEGKCKTFDNSANGFGPGEAVGAIVLKPYDAAIRDGDYIHGVIKGSSINQDGKTNGITAPSTISQTAVELEAYKNAGINPETISYIEAHGTGTKLGDPIEVEALTTAFKKYTDKKQFCNIGSIKTNIGHTAAAAGISGIIKIMLSFKYQTIPASINFQEPNKLIDFQNSPFKVNQKLANWTSPHYPLRRAAISSFGFSGTNAHMVLEEPPAYKKETRMLKPYYLIPLSAENEKVLARLKKQVLKWLEKEPVFHLEDIAYTFQQRREHFSCREIFVVESIQELVEKINKGEALPSMEPVQIDLEETYIKLNTSLTDKSNYKKNLESIAAHYLQGKYINWECILINIEKKYCTVPLPTYPFIGERYWIEENKGSTHKKGFENQLHPLVHKNISTLDGYRFESTFTGKEFYLKNHIVNGQPMFPGAAYIEMGLIAARLINTQKNIIIKEVSWIRPFTVEEVRKLYVDFSISTQDSFKIQFVDEDNLVYASLEGNYVSTQGEFNKTLQLEQGVQLEVDLLYKKFTTYGLEYGKEFRLIKSIWLQEDEATALIEVNDPLQKTLDPFILHPAILDAAFQSLIAFYGFGDEELDGQYLPFSIAEIKVFKALSPSCYLQIRNVTNEKKVLQGIKYFDIFLVNENEQLLVEIKSFAIKKIRNINKSNQEEHQLSAQDIFQQLQEGQISEEEAEKELDKLLISST